MGRSRGAGGFCGWLLAACAALPAAAQPGAEGNPPAAEAPLVSLTAAVAPDRDAFWVLDRVAHRLAVYRFDNAGLAWVATRKLEEDFKQFDFSNPADPKQTPPVLEVIRRANAQQEPPPPLRPPPAVPIGSLLMTKGAAEGGRDAVYVLDGANRRMAVYTTDGKTLTLHYVRDLQADLRPVEYSVGPAQTPTVRQMSAIAPK